MSWSAWTEEGIGITIAEMSTNFEPVGDFEAVMKFIADNQEELTPEEKERILSCKNPNEYWEIEDEYPSETIAGIINRNENTCLFVGFKPDETSYKLNDKVRVISTERLGIAPVYPWHIREQDQGKTLKELMEILKKYAEQMGITEEPDWFTSYYCG